VLLQHRDELAMAVDQSANHRDCVGAHPRIMPGARRLAHAARRVALGNRTYAPPRCRMSAASRGPLLAPTGSSSAAVGTSRASDLPRQ
jgi:hypothetical protein